MPVILENGSEELRTWLDPKHSTWSKELQSLLKPYEGELEIYPVSKDVGKVGNNSPNFIIPIASTENKSNIANFFGKPAANPSKSVNQESTKSEDVKKEVIVKDEYDAKDATKVKMEGDVKIEDIFKYREAEDRMTIDHDGSETHAPLPVPKEDLKQGIKREFDDVPDERPPAKVQKSSASPIKASPPAVKQARKPRSATSNNTASPTKSTGKDKGSQKITSFFSK
jgi:hypothetical protein